MPTKMQRKLLVKRRGVWMNKHCAARREHSPKEAKSCPYCLVCEHGATEYMHCDQCNTDESWRDGPITTAEINKVLDHLASFGNLWLPFLERMPKKKKRYYKQGVPLIPLAVAELRKLVSSVHAYQGELRDAG